jgi:hypothetical protein
MATDYLKTLNSLADQVPGLNQKALKQQQAASDIALQKAVQSAPGGLPQPQQAAQLATQQAYQAGQQLVAQRQQATQQAAQIRQAALAEKQRRGQAGLQQQQLAQQERLATQREMQKRQENRKDLESRKTVLDSELKAQERISARGRLLDTNLQIATEKQREDLARLGNNVKFELLDSRLLFERDNQRRKIITQPRQLSDMAIAMSKDRAEFNRRMAVVDRAHKKVMSQMQYDIKSLEAVLERGYISKKNDLDIEHRRHMLELLKRHRRKLEREAKRARNRGLIIKGVSSVVGAGVGAIGGGPIGGAAASTATSAILHANT